MIDYQDYVMRKLSRVPATGIASGFSVPTSMFMHQSALTAWALRRGRAAIFAGTGLGKSRMQIAWADSVRVHTKRPVLILAPLAVAPQTVAEGAELGISVQHCRDGSDFDPAEGAAIVITNCRAPNALKPTLPASSATVLPVAGTRTRSSALAASRRSAPGRCR